MKKPSEQSSKRPVSRIRTIPELSNKKGSLYQDPRFDTALGKANLTETRRNYAFLDDYRESEVQQLKNNLAKTKDDGEKHILKKAIESQQSRLKTLKQRDKDQDVLRSLKNKKISRAKKREAVLKERFETMNSKDRARAIERRQRKVAQKQKKALPERRE